MMPLYSKPLGNYKEESVMFLPSFRHLIEIEALKTQNQIDLGKISNENKRISDLESLRKKRQEQILSLDQELREQSLGETQQAVERHQQKINKMKSQMDLVTNEKESNALSSQILLVQKELDQLEESYFQKLERQESIAEEKKDHDTFLAGSLLSLNEIKKEVIIEIQKIQQIIDHRLLRIKSLEEQCDSKLIAFYHELETKFKPQRPVAYLIDRKCTHCHMQVDSFFKASVEEGRSFETCPNCSRLLIPETAKIY
jgi:predicted  nucleic acid-binding Zn-ribbon protein